jgi:hypothetical protein
VLRLIEERQRHLRQVDHLDVEPTVPARLVGEPAGERATHPPGPGAGNDDL